MIFGGHPQICVYAAFILPTYAVGQASAVVQPLERIRVLLGMLAIGGFGLALAAVQVWPTLAVQGDLTRDEHLTYEYFAEHSVSPSVLPNAFVPHLSPLPKHGPEGRT